LLGDYKARSSLTHDLDLRAFSIRKINVPLISFLPAYAIISQWNKGRWFRSAAHECCSSPPLMSCSFTAQRVQPGGGCMTDRSSQDFAGALRIAAAFAVAVLYVVLSRAGF
jgi:hypothetical protein